MKLRIISSDTMKLSEPRIIALVRKHLQRKGWTLEPKKNISAQGPDIDARMRVGFQYRYLLIDAKGEMKSLQARSTGLRTLLGQIVSRMKKIERRDTPYFREYGIALPAAYQSQLGKIARGMADMWRVMRLRVFLVKPSGRVEEWNWKDFLRE